MAGPTLAGSVPDRRPVHGGYTRRSPHRRFFPICFASCRLSDLNATSANGYERQLEAIATRRIRPQPELFEEALSVDVIVCVLAESTFRPRLRESDLLNGTTSRQWTWHRCARPAKATRSGPSLVPAPRAKRGSPLSSPPVAPAMAPIAATAIQGGHVTIVAASTMSHRPAPAGLRANGDTKRRILHQGPDKDVVEEFLRLRSREAPRERFRLKSYARAATNLKHCRALVGTEDEQPETPSHWDEATQLYWTELSERILQDRSVKVSRVVILRYEPKAFALEDLHRAIARYEDAPPDIHRRVFVLVGDLAVPDELKDWPLSLLVPKGYLDRLQHTQYDLISEVKCRNLGKRRLLDKLLKRAKTHALDWKRTTGAWLDKCPKPSGAIHLDSATIRDTRNRVQADGPIKLRSDKGHVTCALILTGLLEHLQHAGFPHAYLYFDRRDDPHVRCKVADACATHAVFGAWLERKDGVSVSLESGRQMVDHWFPAEFIEPDVEPGKSFCQSDGPSSRPVDVVVPPMSSVPKSDAQSPIGA